MSLGEQTSTSTINVPDEVAADTGATDVTPEVTETTGEETVSTEDVSYDWNGELESLEDAEWFQNIESTPIEALKETLMNGYKTLRQNATRAVTKHTTFQAQKSRNIEAIEKELEGHRETLRSKIEELGAALSESATDDDKITAMKTGYETQITEFRDNLAALQQHLQQTKGHNQQLASEIQKMRGERQAVQDHFQGQLNEIVRMERQKSAGMKEELETLREQMEGIRAQRMVDVFEGTFKHLKADSDDGKQAMDYYYRLLSAMTEANPNADRTQWEEIDSMVEGMVLKRYPNRNPEAGRTPDAENLANPPNKTSTETQGGQEELQMPSNSIKMFG